MRDALPRVVVILERFPPRTAPFVERKLAILHERGMPISVAARATGPHASDGVPVRTFRSIRGRRLVRHPASCLALLVAAVRRFGFTRRGLRAAYDGWVLVGLRCDLVHFEYSRVAASFTDPLDLLPDLRVMVSCRGSGERVTPLVLPTRREDLRRIFERASLVHCVSSEIAEVVTGLGAPADRVFVNRPAVDAAFFTRSQPMPTGEPTLVAVGRLDWRKGHDVALMAMRRLVDEGVRVRLEIIGEGTERKKLTYMIAALGLGNDVRLRGELDAPGVKAALERATLFVLPSLTEGMSNAALEAMAMEVPVVASDVGGMGEAIDHDLTGFLVPAMDPTALAAAIGDALRRPDLETVGRLARKRVVEDFSIERQAEVFEDAYRRVVER